MGKKHAVLVVEDDPIILQLITELLSAADYTCTWAKSCREARAAVSKHKFTCGLIDLGLPDGDGLGLLPEFKQADPWLVPVILTGDSSSDTIIKTMRAGAFDFLTKPVGGTVLRAAVARAVEHHEAIRDRDRLVQLLSEEREQLRARVEEATSDIRQYAARRNALLRLTRVSADSYTDEGLIRGTFEELERELPIQCVALCGTAYGEFLAGLRGDDGIQVIVTENNAIAGPPAKDEDAGEHLATARAWVNRFTSLDTAGLAGHAYPQAFWGRTICTVAYFLSPEYEVDDACNEFLGMCAHFVASEWQEARLFQHAAQQASLGSIALELSKGFIQGLTAIRTASDFVNETGVTPEAAEGLGIISGNVDGLRSQIQAFRQLSAVRRDSIETVQLDQYIDQAVAMLTLAIQSRGIRIEKDYRGDFECVLLNGTLLARTFLDLISGAVRSVGADGCVALRLSDTEPGFIVFEISHDRIDPELFEGALGAAEPSPPECIENHPSFQLAQRTIRSCGGKLLFKYVREGRSAYRIVLPKNAMNPGQIREVVR